MRSQADDLAKANRLGRLYGRRHASDGAEFPRWNILIQPKEVIWIIVRLNRDHTVPSLLISLGHAILLVAAHKIYVNTRFHSRPKFVEEPTNPGNIADICGLLRPVRQQIHDERSAAIAERGLFRVDPSTAAASLGWLVYPTLIGFRRPVPSSLPRH
jgi:hypothetical protein